MPSLSPTMEAGTLVQWHKKEGDAVAPGDLICEVQTDKAVVGMEIDEEGVLAKILQLEGTVHKIGDIIAILANTEENWEEVNANASAFVASLSGGSAAPATESNVASPVAAPTSSPSSSKPSGKQLPMGPAVRLLLSSFGLSPDQITGTGPNGTILKGDVLSYIAGKDLKKVPKSTTSEPSKPAKADSIHVVSPRPQVSGATYTDMPVSEMRAASAKRGVESKADIPHIYTNFILTVDRLFALQESVNRAQLVDHEISVGDLIVKACAYALRLVPEVNGTSTANGTVFHQSGEVNICVTISTPNGLFMPAVKSADRLTVSEISGCVKNLTLQAYGDELKPEESTGGSFTISNLGALGVREFTSIINSPQVAILSVGSGQRRLRLSPTGDLQPVTTLTLTLSSDARFIDEVTATRFLRHVQNYLESNPESLFEDDPLLATKAGCRDLSVMAF